MKKTFKEENAQPAQLVIPCSLLSWVEASSNEALKLTPEKSTFLKAIDAEILSSQQKTTSCTEAMNAEKLNMSPEQFAQVKHIALLTVKQTATLLNVTNQYIYKMLSMKSFPEPVKLGRMTRFRLVDLEHYLNTRLSQQEQDGGC